LDTSNYAGLVPRLRVDQWLRDRVTRAAQSGRVVIIPDRYLRIERWHGTGWTELDPLTGAGGYLIVGVMTYMREGEAGNTSISLGPEHVSVGGYATQPMDMGVSASSYEGRAKETAGAVENASIDKVEEVKEYYSYMLVPLPVGLFQVGVATHALYALPTLGFSVTVAVGAASLVLLPVVLVYVIVPAGILMDPYGAIYVS
jgi:hypothetical protein